MIKIYHNEKFNIKHIDLPSKPISSIYETVIIEFELLPQLEDILRYTILQLPNWNHTIICGFKNTHMIAEWNLPLQIITLPMDTLEPFEYNQLFMEESFWNRFEGTKLLFYTKDSIVLHSDLEEFIHYDFIPPNQQISFRDKNCMLKCIQTPTKIRINERWNIRFPVSRMKPFSAEIEWASLLILKWRFLSQASALSRLPVESSA